MKDSDTICAIATGMGQSAIGIIRISGEDAIGKTDKIFRGKKKLSEMQSFTAAFGRICDSAISVRYPAHSPAWWEQVGAGLIGRGAPETLPILPSQLIEAAANLVLFAALFVWARKKPREGAVAGAYLIAYAVIRFCTETLRSDPRMMVGPLTISQFLGLGVFAAGAALLLRSRRTDKC